MWQRVKKILLPHPKGPQRWWHRFANVLIYGSTIFVFFFLVIMFVEDAPWLESRVIDVEKGMTRLTEKQIQENVEAIIIQGGNEQDVAGYLTQARWNSGQLITTTITTNYRILFLVGGFIMGITVGWFIFWTSIVYRAFLYVVHGGSQK